MRVPSLAQLARQACIKNANSITDVGDAQYDLVRPILLRLHNPKQLYQIEQVCPQIIGADAEVWKEFCRRDVPNYEKYNQEPADPKNWYKCYQKLYKLGQKEIDADAALMKATMDDIKSKQAEHKAQQVELRGVKVPTGLKKDIPTIALPKGSGVYRAIGHPKERSHDPVAKAPAKAISTVAKIRKETAAQSKFSVARQLQRGIITPRDMLNKARPTTPIVRAPKSLIDAHQKAKIPEPIDPTIQPSPMFNPRKRRIEHVETAEPDSSERIAREKRLRALTNPSDAGKVSSKTATETSKPTTPKPTTSKPTTSKPMAIQRADPKVDSSNRQEPIKTNRPQPSPSKLRADTLSPNQPKPGVIRSLSPTARLGSPNPPSPQIRPPMRIHRASDNPLRTPKRRPLLKT